MKVELRQRTPEWLEWKKNKIGSSDVATIMGLNPWETPLQLYNRMKGLAPEKPVTAAMRRGVELEDDILSELVMKTGIPFSPACFEFDGNPRLIASLDGANLEQKFLAEIKSSDSSYRVALQGFVPEWHKAQIQHQLLVTGWELGFYCVSSGFDLAIVEVRKDNEFQQEILRKCEEFLHFLDNDIPPIDENAHIAIELSEDQKEIVDAWLLADRQLKETQNLTKSLKTQIEELGDAGNFELIYGGIPLLRLTRVNREGNIDWEKLCKDKGISPDQIKPYRKQQIGYYKICEVK